MPSPASAPTAAQIYEANLQARRVVTTNSVKMKQQIFSQTVNPATQNVLNVQPRNVGIILGFIVEVTGGLTNGSALTINRTNFGNANMVSSFQFQDLNNYTRIQVPGWYLAVLDSARARMGYGGVIANNIPMGYGNNVAVYQGASSYATMVAGTLRMMYYVPLAYSPDDLRGAIYAATVSATMNLQITLNTTPVVSSVTDQLNAVYVGATAGSVAAATWTSTVTVTVYQVYYDQIPRYASGQAAGQPILPLQDLNTVYDLKQTTFPGITAGQDFPMAYSNFRSFLSTYVVYDNAGVYVGGTDINYFSLASANFTNIFKLTPEIVALEQRPVFMADPPIGTYWFESRQTPINTINYGNMELNINASSASAGAQVLVGYESFALVNQLVGATSIASGNG